MVGTSVRNRRNRPKRSKGDTGRLDIEVDGPVAHAWRRAGKVTIKVQRQDENPQAARGRTAVRLLQHAVEGKVRVDSAGDSEGTA